MDRDTVRFLKFGTNEGEMEENLEDKTQKVLSESSDHNISFKHGLLRSLEQVSRLVSNRVAR